MDGVEMSEHMKPQVSVADELDPVQEIQVIITTQLPKSFINTKPLKDEIYESGYHKSL